MSTKPVASLKSVWPTAGNLQAKSFICGYCGEKVASEKGWEDHSVRRTTVRICPGCSEPSILGPEGQFPGPPFGQHVASLPTDIERLYTEARRCTTVGAYTAAVITARKVLMHLAVEQGAKPGATFKQYVEHLEAKGFVPPNGKPWVDRIRDRGNDANHEIVLMGETEAREVLRFLEMLLKFIYEYPALVTA